MKKMLIIFLVLAALVFTSTIVFAGKPDKPVCTTIQDGTLVTSTGEVIKAGFDVYGYSYQAHQYIGYYGNYQRPPLPVDEGYALMMKWNEGWLSNKDCDGDGLLDRHYGFDSYIGSGAWLTNHQRGEYTENGEVCKYEYFVKIIAPPADADLIAGVWYAADGTEIGPVIWGEFAIIQSVYNDPCGGYNGVEYLSPDHVGFGGW